MVSWVKLAKIRLREDVLKTSLLFFFRRCLQDVLKTSWSRQVYLPWSNVFKRRDILKTTCSRQLYLHWSYVFKTSQDIYKMSSWCLQDVFKMSSRRLQDVFNIYPSVDTSLTCFQYVQRRCISTERFTIATVPEKFAIMVQIF